jgi:hypothetical protein
MSMLTRVLLTCALMFVLAIAALVPGAAGVAAFQTDPCATPSPTVEVPTETATTEPTSTLEPTSTDIATSTTEPTSTSEATAQPDSVPPDQVNINGSLVRYIQQAGIVPCETVTAEPTDEATLVPATEEPSEEATTAPTEQPVSQLPNTGSGSGDSNSIAMLFVVLGAAGIGAWGMRKFTFGRS